MRQANFVAKILQIKKRDRMIDKLTISQRGHTILLGNSGLGLLNGLIVTGKMCEYAEGSMVEYFIAETRNRKKGISSTILKAIHNMESSEYFPAPFNL